VRGEATPAGTAPRIASELPRSVLRDGLIVSIGGQIERALGIATALVLRWGLDPSRLGVYSGLRIYLDQTNRSSLGIGLGAVQEIPVLRAAGRHAEARHIADVACTASTIACLLYALALLAWAAIRAPIVAGDPLAAEWTWGLVAFAGLTLVQRRLSFHVAVLRARGEFTLTTEVDLFEALVTIALVSAGLALAGFWGLIAAVGLILVGKSIYLRARHPLRFRWAWDGPLIIRLLRVGLPIFAATAALGVVTNLDRVLILWLWPRSEAARAAGLYSVAVLGAGWGLDLAGRIATVLYTQFQTTLGRTLDPEAVALQAARSVEAQAPLLAFGASASCVLGPGLLAALLPRYAEGLVALIALAPGMTLLALSWPARQSLIAVGKPYRVVLATLLGGAVAALAVSIGSTRGGLTGVAWGTSIGYVVIYAATSMAAFCGALGRRSFLMHQARVLLALAWFAAGGMLAIASNSPALRCMLLAVWSVPAVVFIRRPGSERTCA
jgi:O-antigen/teichoic acid export membrane protein